MIGSLLVAFVLAGPSFGRATTLSSGPVVSGPADVNPFLPLFEFAPTSGVGLDPLGSCNCNSTNLTAFPQDIDNAAWTKLGVTSAAPVVTANFAQDPTGAFGAERVQIASCAGNDTASFVDQLALGITGSQSVTASAYCRGTYATQTISICAYDTSVPTGTCSQVTCSATAWTRFSVSRTSVNGTGIVLGCNNILAYTNPSNTGTADVLLWGGNVTVGASVLPYVTIPESNVGGTMVFARASTATCLATVGTSPQTIANGDLVTCATGQVRMMPGTDGTSMNGALVEAARTNLLLRSQEFNNLAWTKSNSGSSLPVVTADAAIAPDGTLTADRIQFAATAVSERSIVFQSSATGGPFAGSIFLKGNGSSGVTDLCVHQTAGNYVCTSCAYTSTSWMRCLDENVNDTAITFIIGNDTLDNGGTTRIAADVFVWGADCEVGTYASSYIATTTIATARAEEAVADFPLSISLPSSYIIATTISGSNANVVAARFHGTIGNLAAGIAGGSSSYDDSFFTGGLWRAESSSVSSAVTLTTPYTNGSRWASYYDGTAFGACKDGTCATVNAAYSAPAWTRWRSGSYGSGNGFVDGVIKRACIDTSIPRCL